MLHEFLSLEMQYFQFLTAKQESVKYFSESNFALIRTTAICMYFSVASPKVLTISTRVLAISAGVLTISTRVLTIFWATKIPPWYPTVAIVVLISSPG